MLISRFEINHSKGRNEIMMEELVALNDSLRDGLDEYVRKHPLAPIIGIVLLTVGVLVLGIWLGC